VKKIAELPRELALRIALAARILPAISVPKLLKILHERLGSPLEDEKLKAITVTNLKTGLGSLDGEEDGEDIGIGLANYLDTRARKVIKAPHLTQTVATIEIYFVLI
jgi:hypothetical protein